MNFSWIVNLFGPVVGFYLVVGSRRSSGRHRVAFDKKELPPPARGAMCYMLSSSGFPTCFTPKADGASWRAGLPGSLVMVFQDSASPPRVWFGPGASTLPTQFVENSRRGLETARFTGPPGRCNASCKARRSSSVRSSPSSSATRSTTVPSGATVSVISTAAWPCGIPLAIFSKSFRDSFRLKVKGGQW